MLTELRMGVQGPLYQDSSSGMSQLQGTIILETNFIHIYVLNYIFLAVAQWLRCCATNQKVAGSIPAGVIGIFH